MSEESAHKELIGKIELIEKSLTDSQRREKELKQLFDSVPVGIARVVNRNFLEVNQRFCDTIGYTSEELVGQSTEICYFDRAEFERAGKELYRQITETGQAGIEARAKRKDGKLIYVLISTYQKNPKDLSSEIIFAVTDITEQKMVESELKRAKAFTDNLIRTANVMIVGLDPEGKIFLVNPAVEQITGYPKAELEGKNWFETVVPTDKYPDVKEEFKHLLKGYLPRVFQNPILTKSGEERIITWSNSEIREYGRIIGTLSFGIDITDKMEAEKSLHLINASVDFSADCVIWVNKDGSFGYVNEQTCRMTEYSREELLQMTISDIDPTFNGEMFSEAWERLKTEKSAVIEGMQKTKSGKTRPMEIRLNYLEFDNNEYAFAYASDITERKKAEEALKMTQAAVDGSSDAIFFLTRDMKFGYVNDQACRSLGYTREELLNMSLADIDPDYEQDKAEFVWDQMRKDKTQIIERMHRTKSGRVFPVEIKSNFVLYKEREYIFSFVRDISKRKEAQRKIQESEEKLSKAFESNATLMLIFDVESGRRLMVNEAYARTLGISKEEVIGTTLDDFNLFVDYNKVKAALKRLPKERVITDFEVDLRTKDGKIITLLYNLSMLDIPDSNLAVISALDITARKEAEAELKETLEKLQEEQKALNEKNIALNQILSHMEVERAEYKSDVTSRFEKAIKPYLKKLRQKDGQLSSKEVSLLVDAVNSVVGNEIDNFESNYSKLSSREMDICNLIKIGKSSKEIADELHLSVQTIQKHRTSIREKLRLKNKDISLVAYLQNK